METKGQNNRPTKVQQNKRLRVKKREKSRSRTRRVFFGLLPYVRDNEKFTEQSHLIINQSYDTSILNHSSMKYHNKKINNKVYIA